MDARIDDISERLRAIAEELADLALDQLRRAIDDEVAEGEIDERRLTRARRAVEKAAGLLRPEPGAW